MNIRNRLSLRGCTVGILVLMVCGSLAADKGLGLRRERSGLSDFLWKEMVTRLEKYPLPIEKGRSQKLLVQIADDSKELFSSIEWASKEKVVERSGARQRKITLADSMDEYVLSICFSVGTNAEEQLQETIEQSFSFFYGSSRPSTWMVQDKEDGSVKVAYADFVASMIPISGYPDRVYYCIENLQVSVASVFEVGAKFPADRLAEVNTRISSLFGGEQGHKLKAAGDEIDLAVLGTRADNTVRIKWSSSGNLKGYWVRMDIDAGSLSIEEKGIVKAASVPDTGATVHLYAISPDGKTWFHKKLRLPASK